MFDLLIFDCDGTLVDSETLHNTASSQVITELGFPQYTPAYCLEHFTGAGQAHVWHTVEREQGIKVPADINRRYIDRVIALQKDYAKVAPGVEAVLDFVRGKHKLCVASNGEPENVHGLLNLTGLIRYFKPQDVYTASMVANPKPAPDLFLWAAQSQQARAESCLVIEDSVAGATAGVRAGMTVFGYTGLAHDKEEQAQKLKNAGVPHVSDSWDDFLDLLDGASF